MKYRNLSGWYLICLIIFASCKPNNNTPSNSIIGTWKFTNQFNQTYSYPSILNDPLPISVSGWSISTDSIRATFDNNGNYSFVNFRSPKENGTYSILQDSLLIIKPDTSGFENSVIQPLLFMHSPWYRKTPCLNCPILIFILQAILFFLKSQMPII